LALRFLFQPAFGSPRPALIADDQVELRRHAECIVASAPPRLAGKIEVRGIGIIDVAFEPAAKLGLLVDLVPREEIARLPDTLKFERKLGIAIPKIQLDPFDSSAHLKLMLAIQNFGSKPVD
jgi:serine kinase of HPr protein (carbohydrate metabolism regulator)